MYILYFSYHNWHIAKYNPKKDIIWTKVWCCLKTCARFFHAHKKSLHVYQLLCSLPGKMVERSSRFFVLISYKISIVSDLTLKSAMLFINLWRQDLYTFLRTFLEHHRFERWTLVEGMNWLRRGRGFRLIINYRLIVDTINYTTFS